MHRINVVGTSGSGKSTFSRQLATKLNCRYIEMDLLHWLPNWQGRSDDDFISVLTEQLSADTWVLDGNYHRTRSVKWAKADTIIWLDYSFTLTFYQAIKRAIHRCLSRQELWPDTGNVETFRKTFFSRESILVWTLKTHKTNRQRYYTLMENSDYQHLKFVHLKNPKQTRKFLSALDRPDKD